MTIKRNGPAMSIRTSIVALSALTFAFAACLLPLCARADSARTLVSKGNAAYAGAKYDEALSAYEEASVEAPNSPIILFNKAAANCQKGDYSNAVARFEQAASDTKDLKLAARSKYNLGNCACREAERQKDSDLKKCIESYEKSIRLYQEALKLDPELKQAAENIEIVRLLMKTFLDELKKREEEAKKQQQEQQKLAEQLKELIAKQEKAADKSKDLAEQQQKGQEPDKTRDQSNQLADEQQDLRDQTRDTSGKLPQSPQQQKPNQPDPARQAKEHMDNAAAEQKQAEEKLRKEQPGTASENQRKAAEELKKALAALSQDNNQPGGQQQQQEQNQQKKESAQQQQDAGDSAQDQGTNQMDAAMLPDEARDIINEEDRNKEQRKVPFGGYRQVDKDW